MGVGPAFAIAAALYARDHAPATKIVCVEGDSAIGFSAMELETVTRFKTSITIKLECIGTLFKVHMYFYRFRYNLPIVFVVINNNGITFGVDPESYKDMTSSGNDPCLT